MAQSPDTMGTKVYSLLMFLLVSALSGLLIAGLFVPAAALVGAGAKASSVALDALPAELETPPQAETSKMLMADGSLLAKIYSDDRTYVPLSAISEIMRKAQVTIEDKRFYEHGAMDFRGTMRALLTSGGSQGGSSLTQQYVKQVQINAAHAKADNAGVAKAQEHSIARKVQELRYAIALEKKLSKDEILERYLNIAYYGDGSYGVESAARHYFNKTAHNLTLAEAAMLAGLVKSPQALNPVSHPQAAIDRRNTVLAVMLAEKVITKAEHDAAVKVPFDQKLVQSRKRGCMSSQFPHLCNYALNELLASGQFGADKKTSLETIERGGFAIKLTIDPKNQKMAEDQITSQIPATSPAIGLMNVVEPQTGRIVVMAQSRPRQGTGEGETFYNYNASKAMGGASGFQPGSNFKVFTVAAAIQQGIPPTRKYDAKNPMQFKGTTFKSCDGPFKFNSDWNVKNDGGRSGMMDMIFASQHSVNTYFIQLERDTGICAAVEATKKAGVAIQGPETWEEMSNYPSYTLGAAEVVPVTMASAFGTFANRGVRCAPTMVDSIKTKAGKAVEWKYPKCARAFAPEVADGVNEVLRNVAMNREGSGFHMYIPGYQLAGKTGTTNSWKALWYTAYSPNLSGSSAIVVDPGNPYWDTHGGQKNSSLKRAGLPGMRYNGWDPGDKIWRPIMKELLAQYPKDKFTPPTKEVKEGKLVDIPRSTGDPDTDEKQLIDAGFLPQRVQVASYRPAGTYLGQSRSGGKAPTGTTIQLRFSSGAAPKPKADPTTDPNANQPKADVCPNGDYTGNRFDKQCGTKPAAAPKADVCPNGDYTGSTTDGQCGTKPAPQPIKKADVCPNGDYTGNRYDGQCGTKPAPQPTQPAKPAQPKPTPPPTTKGP